jgi:hypothetical protein
LPSTDESVFSELDTIVQEPNAVYKDNMKKCRDEIYTRPQIAKQHFDIAMRHLYTDYQTRDYIQTTVSDILKQEYKNMGLIKK